jgi:spore coat protein JB
MELKKEMAAIHMMIVELNLYLNTHPYDKDALMVRNAYVKQYRDLKDQYDQCYGMTNSDYDQSSYPWQWIEEPWPWECEANFRV